MALTGFLRKTYNGLTGTFYVAAGKRPWGIGYGAYRQKSIVTALNERRFKPEALESGYGYKLDERIVEYPWLFSRLPEGKGRLLDAGSVLNFDYILSRETLQNKHVFISTLAPEPQNFCRYGISYVFEDLRDACYKDGYFDWIVSLSTLEHIGLDNTMLYTDDQSKRENIRDAYLTAVRECHRILRKGGKLYASFPFGAYKNHGWFQVFDAPMVDSLIEAFSPSHAREFYFRYDRSGWRTSSREDCKGAACRDATVHRKYTEGSPVFSEAVACLELEK